MLARVYRAGWNINPIWASVVALVAGVVLLFASFPLNIAFVSYEVNGFTKQVGFVPALNWSFVLTIVFPAAIFTMLLTVRRLDRTLKALASHRMLVDPDQWTPATKEQIAALSNRVWAAASPIGLIFFLAGLGITVWDWANTVARPLLGGMRVIEPGQIDFYDELDWSVSALFGGISHATLPTLHADFVFGAAAYLVMGIEMAAILSFYGFLIGVSAEIYALSEKRRDLLLIPDPLDTDRRRGFELFAGFFGGVLVTTLLGYIAAYLMRVQNLFMRDSSFDRLDNMIFGAIYGNLTQAFHLPQNLAAQSALTYLGQNVSDLADAIFTTGSLGDVQAYLGATVILVVMLLVTGALFAVLRIAADESRDTLVQELADAGTRPKIERLFGVPATDVAKSLESTSMVIWPLRWPNVNGLLALLTLGIVCFLFYRLALIWIAVQIMALFRVRTAD